MPKGFCQKCRLAIASKAHKIKCPPLLLHTKCLDCDKPKRPSKIDFRCHSCAAKWRHKNLAGYTAKVLSPEIRAKQHQSYMETMKDPSKRHWGKQKSHGKEPATAAQKAAVKKVRPWESTIPWRQIKLAEALGPPWINELVLPTKKPWPFPSAYKIDIAHQELKIAIEVGNWPSPRKTQWYQENGWTLLHFSNKMVEVWMEGCLVTAMSMISQLKVITIS